MIVTIEATSDSDFNGIRLVDTVRQAAPDDTIQLRQGVYRLPSTLVVERSLSLTGQGEEGPRLICDAEGAVLRFTGQGRLSAANLAFVHEGDRWANVVVIDGGDIDVQRCSFSGGIFDEPNERGGTGLTLAGAAHGVVAQCEAVGNQRWGFGLDGAANVLLHESICRENGQSGIEYHGRAGGTARGNTCTANGVHGIRVTDSSRPLLESNTCRGNKGSGILAR